MGKPNIPHPQNLKLTQSVMPIKSRNKTLFVTFKENTIWYILAWITKSHVHNFLISQYLHQNWISQSKISFQKLDEGCQKQQHQKANILAKKIYRFAKSNANKKYIYNPSDEDFQTLLVEQNILFHSIIRSETHSSHPYRIQLKPQQVRNCQIRG